MMMVKVKCVIVCCDCYSDSSCSLMLNLDHIYSSCVVQGFLALEGELTPILVQMVKSANMNGLLDNDNESSKYQNM